MEIALHTLAKIGGKNWSITTPTCQRSWAAATFWDNPVDQLFYLRRQVYFRGQFEVPALQLPVCNKVSGISGEMALDP